MNGIDKINENRLQIMGFAALWIMLFHSTIKISFIPFDFIIKIGYLGVDIFMFMSGFSMYKSYHSCTDLREFYKKRLKRILPTFLPFAIMYWLRNLIGSEIILISKDFLINIIAFRWFVPCILLCYLLTPIINIFFIKYGYTKRSLLLLNAFFICIAIVFVFIKSSVALMILIRIPEYIIGWYYKQKEKSYSSSLFIHNKEKFFPIFMRVFVLISSFIILYFLLKNFQDSFLADTGLYWWPAVICISSLVLCIVKIIHPNFIFDFMGKYSLELYLWHPYLCYPLESYLKDLGIKFDKSGIIINIFGILISCIVAWFYSKGITLFKNIVFREKK